MKDRFVGISGVGVDLPDGRHVYVYIAAVREDGSLVAEASNAKGLSLAQCLKVLFALAKRDVAWGFQTTYHATKILEGIKEPLDLFRIFHPESRRKEVNGKTVTPLVRIADKGYTVDQSGFTVATGYGNGRWRRTVRVWDLHNFTRRSWDDSLRAWYVSSTPLRNAQRKAECIQRCWEIARLARKVTSFAEKELDVDFRGIYRGPGSIASVLLRKEDVDSFRAEPPEEVPVAAAYFGGRQEIAQVGPVEGPLYEYDIRNAYAWALGKLPCLACGKWRKTNSKSVVYGNGLALVKFRLRDCAGWAPLPCRIGGAVAYGSNFSGWGWWPDVHAAQHAGHKIHVQEAWVYSTACGHRPFAFVDRLCALRAKLAEGKADLVKAVMVAIYGKLLQRMASPWQSLTWAGMTTAIVRSRMALDLALGDEEDAVAISTDALITKQRLAVGPRPGEWRLKATLKRGVFLLPDGSFALPPDGEDEKKILAAWKAGRKVVFKERVFFDGGHAIIAMVRCRRCGKTWSYEEGIRCRDCGIVGGVPRASYLGSAPYGRWGRQAREVTFEAPRRNRDLGGVESESFR